jgi:hypothetical protein
VLAVGGREGRAERRRQLALPRREREHHRRRRRPAHERGQGLDGRRIGPLHVVRPENERVRGGKRPEQLAQGPVRTVAVAVRRVAPGKIAVQGLGPERVRQIALELRRARPEHRAGTGARDQVVEQPRLADPRLPFDGDDHARARGQRPQRGGDRLALRDPPDQRSLVHTPSLSDRGCRGAVR